MTRGAGVHRVVADHACRQAAACEDRRGRRTGCRQVLLPETCACEASSHQGMQRLRRGCALWAVLEEAQKDKHQALEEMPRPVQNQMTHLVAGERLSRRLPAPGVAPAPASGLLLIAGDSPCHASCCCSRCHT